MSQSPKPIQSIAAEQSVIGSCLLSRDAYELVSATLKAEDFTDELCRRAWSAIEQQSAGGGKWDIVAIGSRLPDDLPNLAVIARDTPSAANVESYAGIVRNASELRRLAAIGGKIQSLAYTEKHAAEACSKAVELLKQAETTTTEGPRIIGDLLRDWADDLEQRLNRPDDLLGLSTGLVDVDSWIDGLCPGRLYVVAGRPAMGKSIFGLQSALTASVKAGKPTVLFTLEMSANDLIYRAVSCAKSIGIKNLLAADLSDEEWKQITAFVAVHQTAKLWLDDSSKLHIRDICARTMRVHRKEPLGLVVVDYLQLATGDGENRAKEVGSISRALKALAKELSVPVLALAQVSRECEKRTDRRPIMADLRESGELEQDADLVAFLYRDDVYNPHSTDAGVAEFLIRKNRQGKNGMVRLQFDGEHSRFRDFCAEDYLSAQPLEPETKVRGFQ